MKASALNLIGILLFVPLGCNPTSDQDTGRINLKLFEGTNLAAALSPSGKQIVHDLQGTLWLMNSEGGDSKAITDSYGDARQPAWSPDGEQICFQAYWEGNWHIYSINSDGTGLQQLTNEQYDHREPHWSPRGDRIIFSSDRSGNYDIWALMPGEGQPNQLTSTTSHDEYGPVFSSDGTSMVYVARQGSSYSIRQHSFDGSHTVDLFESEEEIYGLAFDPEDRYLLFNAVGESESQLMRLKIGTDSTEMLSVSDPDEDVFPFRPTWLNENEFIYTSSGRIWRRSINGEAKGEIPIEVSVSLERPSYVSKKRMFDLDSTRPSKGIYQPVLSPMGSSIAFISQADVWIKNLNEQSVRITKDPFIQICPAWSPDGRLLAYASDVNDSSAIWIYDSTLDTFRRVGNIPALPAGIDWSPDGTQLAFTTNYGPRVGVLWSMSVQTGEISRVGNTYPYSISGPSWSADGSWIALSVLVPYSDLYREGINRLVLASADGSNTRYPVMPSHQSVGMRGNDGPNWSPDGSRIAFLSNGFLWVAKVSASGDFLEPPQQLTEELADAPSWSGDSQSLLFQHDDELKIVQAASGEALSIAIELTFEPKMDDRPKVIRAGGLINGLENIVHENKDIIISGHRIIDILDHDPNRSADTVIDASAYYVMPGLIDIHAHQSSEMGHRLGKKWLAWGVTSTRDPATNPYDALNRREAQQSGSIHHPRIFFTGSPFDGSRVFYSGTYALQSKTQLEMELQRAESLDYDMIKTYVRLPDSWQEYLTKEAHDLGIPVSSHELYPAVSYGVDAVEHITGTSRRGYSPKMSRMTIAYSDVIDLISKSGMYFTPTISIYVGYNYVLSQDSTVLDDARLIRLESERYLQAARQGIDEVNKQPDLWQQRFNNAAAMIRQVHENGGNVVAGTDSPIIPFGFGLHVELECYQRAGLSPFATLRSATIQAAKGIGVSSDLGSIETGKLADLLIVRKNPLEDIRNARDIESVILNGHLIPISSLLE